MEMTSNLSLVSSTSVGENLMVKTSSQLGLMVPECGETVKNPESIFPDSELTILQL